MTAVRICATNAVRHARADNMRVEIGENGKNGKNAVSITVTNNGDAPKREIIEGGGLTSLRRRVEKSGGVMTVRSLPSFELAIMLPKEESVL